MGGLKLDIRFERMTFSLPVKALSTELIQLLEGSDRFELSKITFIHFLEEVVHDTNSVLLPETLHQLNIYP